MNKGIENVHKGMIAVLAVMLVLLVAAVGTASAASEWDAVFGGDGSDNAYSVEQTDDGGYILTGYKAFPERKVWLLKTDSSGVREWDRAFGGDSSWGQSVRQTNDSGYIVTGFTETYGDGGYDVWLIKTDSSGNEVWNKTFGNTDQDYGKSVRQTSDGGYIVAGSTDIQIGSGTQYAAWLIKTDFSGKEDWNQTYDYDTGMDEFYSVQQTSDGGYIAAGYSKNTTTGGRYGIWLLRTDSDGTELWNKTFGKADETDYGHEVRIEETSSSYIIGGRTKSYGAGNYDVWLIKTDPNGDELWNRTYGGSGSDSGYSMDVASDGGYVIAGNTKSYGAGKYDFWLVKTDSNGNEEWDMTFGGPEDDGACSVDVTDDGSYVIAGYTKSGDPGNKDIWLVHTEGPACIGENYRFTCGDVVNESCTFNANLACPAATAGLIIGADGITINGAGYKITGDLTGATCAGCGADAPCTLSGIYNDGHDNV
ncbi:MAG: hypothetical protein U9Q68_06170, partial [Euryarchaeota archaeon]|nr:hypothetical protein [Euryarchaeota archaeon]